MSEKNENSILNLVSCYRDLKRDRDILDAEMKAVKEELQPLLAPIGSWTDDDGYARIVHRGPIVSYNPRAVHTYAQAWLESDDPILKSCGQMLEQVRSERAAVSYVQVK